MKTFRILIILFMLTQVWGCVLTKLVTVPMRAGAAVVSIVPVLGNSAHDSIDAVADKVDDLPL